MPPVSARKVVQTYMSKLRQILPAGMLVTRQTGYGLWCRPMPSTRGGSSDSRRGRRRARP